MNKDKSTLLHVYVFLVPVRPGRGGGECSQKLGGGVRPLPKTLTLFLQHALSSYVYNRSLFAVFTKVEMAEK